MAGGIKHRWIVNILFEEFMPNGVSFVMVPNDGHKMLTIYLIKKFSGFGKFAFTAVGGTIAGIYDYVGRIRIDFFKQKLIVTIPVAWPEMQVGYL
jgi:hypothetical protein